LKKTWRPRHKQEVSIKIYLKDKRCPAHVNRIYVTQSRTQYGLSRPRYEPSVPWKKESFLTTWAMFSNLWRSTVISYINNQFTTVLTHQITGRHPADTARTRRSVNDATLFTLPW